MARPQRLWRTFRLRAARSCSVIEGGEVKAPQTDEAAVREEIDEMKRLGLTRAQAQPLIERRFGINRRTFYGIWVRSDG